MLPPTPDGLDPPPKHSTRAKRGSSGRLISRVPLGVGDRAVDSAAVFRPPNVQAAQSRVTMSSSSVLTGPWYLFFAEIRYQTPKTSGITIAAGV